MRTRVVVAPAVVGGIAALVVGSQVLGRTAGSSRAERRATLPGDELVSDPQVVTDHALDVDATPAEIWPWLTQTGWHRGGWYTPRWVDRLLFPANWPSADQLDPVLLRELAVGETIPDGPPGTAEFVVLVADAPHSLVLRSTTHLPVAWRERFGATIDWTWSFRLTETPAGSRLHVRVRGRSAPWWLTAAYVGLLVPADYVMGLGMLRGLKVRAEGLSARGAEPDRSQRRDAHGR